MKKFFKQKKAGTLAVLILFVFVQFGGILIPQPAHAQWAVMNPDLIAAKIQQILKDITKSGIEKAFISSLASTLMNQVLQTGAQILQEAVINVASGGPGGSPLFENLPIKEAVKLTGLNEAFKQMTSIKSSDAVLEAFGVNVPDDPAFLRAVRKGIKQDAVGRRDGVNFGEIMGNFKSYTLSVFELDITAPKRTAIILRTLSGSFDDNEFMAGASIQSKSAQKIQEEKRLAEAKQRENAGFKDEINPITKEVTKPAEQVKEEYYEALKKQKYLPFELAINSPDKDVLLQMGAYAGSLLGNAIFSGASKLLKKGPLEGLQSILINPFDPDSSRQPVNVEEKYREILSFRPIKVSDYNLLSRLSSCPEQFLRNSPQLFSCAIDTSFASAIARADIGVTLTLKDAIAEGYIDENWSLIPASDTARNQDSNCYKYGFCQSNLVKLRKARIIPVGWEMAAASRFNKQSNPVTLGTVMNAFDQCDPSGKPTAANPWCHLIDPNWVLVYPEAQCRTLGFGQLLEASGAVDRAEECVDIQSCISENDDGTCDGGFGYCVREKNVWQFRGDECPAEFASCLSFTSSAGEAVSLLTNSVDFAGCNSDSVGCKWYATQKQVLADESFDWPNVYDLAVVEERNDIYKNRIYFNDKVEVCNEEDGGCVELYNRSNNLSLNLVRNPSFEADLDDNNLPDAWIASSGGSFEYSTDDSESRSGSDAIRHQDQSLRQYGIVLDQSQFYSLSFYINQTGFSPSLASVRLSLSAEGGAEETDLTGTSFAGDCTIMSSDSIPGSESVFMSVPVSVDDIEGYQRFECVFTSPTYSDSSLRVNAELVVETANAWIDDIQLEQNEDITPFHENYSALATSLSKLAAKLPPDYLGCRGLDSDPAECANYVQLCRESDQGCTLYTPDNGDPSLSGVVNELDVCPNACLGYDTFKQEPTRYEPNGEFPIFFIPASGETCSESAIGCDEFTNIATEEREYFTYLRACITDDQAELNLNGDNKGVYYTWIGSDQSGFQLQTWNLLASDISDAPCTNWVTTASGITCDDDADGNFIYDKFTPACDEHEDIFRNPDCREFYDAEGDLHYREWSQTVTVKNECATYRKTESGGEENCLGSGGYFDAVNNACLYNGDSENSVLCSASENGCRKYTGGSSRNSRLVLEEIFESGDLTAWDTFSPGNVTLSNNSLASGGHSIQSNGAAFWAYIYNNRSACADEEGCASTLSGLGGACTAFSGEQYCGTLSSDLFQNKTYTVSFWAMGTGNIKAGFDKEWSSASVEIDVPLQAEPIVLTSEWKRYVFGPFDMNAKDHPDFGEGTTLVFMPVAGTGVFNIDNIVIREGEQDITIIKDSWVTPASCDINLAGQSSPQYHLGCAQYTDQNGRINHLKSVSRLCSEDVIGCEGYYRTFETDETNAQIIGATCNNLDRDFDGTPDVVSAKTACYLRANGTGDAFVTTSPKLCDIPAEESSCSFDLDQHFPADAISTLEFKHINFSPETVLVKADRAVYAVINSEDICAGSAVGCSELGLPNLTADKSSIESFTSVWLLNDPDAYSQTLCNEEILYCEAFNAGANGTWYFKDPLKQKCEFKTDILINGQPFAGWFREGTTNLCYGAGTCSNSTLTCSLDSDCRLGSCSGSASACSSDFDCPVTESCEIEGEPVCEIDSGSFVIGGNESGIWRNGDLQYEGWAAVCAPEWNNCSEFRDPLDLDDSEFYGETDGQAYFFINNDKIGESNLLASQKCGGQVSSKQGCTLFLNTGEPRIRYNASATYTASNNADVIFGRRKFDLVDPIVCDKGEDASIIETPKNGAIDLCASRCVYSNKELFSVAGGPAFDTPVIDQYTYGGSCYSSNDCQGYENQLGDIVEGECKTVVSVLPVPGFLTQDDVAVPRLEDDTNRVIKVNRDRQCSEWLTCSQSQTIWDEEISAYRTVCEDIDLCTQYSSRGNSSFCSQWDLDDPAVVLDEARYALRDVTWYGEEYSGYAIPNIFPAQHLSQVNIAAEKVCDADSEDQAGLECTSDAFCGSGECIENPASEFKLGYKAGKCTVVNGEACTVGYCEDTGAACSDDTNCTNSRCIVGECLEVSTRACNEDTPCAGVEETCFDGFCASEEGICDLNSICEPGASTAAKCFPSVKTKKGSCFNRQCILAVDGGRFDDEVAEAAACRANPEIDSPFGNEVVKDWIDAKLLITDRDTNPTPGPLAEIRSLPYKTRGTFENANLCAPGEVCECSYKKISTSIGVKAYVAADRDIKDIVEDLKDAGSTGSRLGICSGGDADGSFCTQDEDCGETDPTGDLTQFGRCYPITREDTLLGLEGYCLERDSGININGDPTTGACLTWFPVDKLDGSTDLFAKYQGAGFVGDAYYCSEIKMAANIGTVQGCSVIRGSDGDGLGPEVGSDVNEEESEWCQQTVSCPAGYWAIVGRATWGGDEDESGDASEICKNDETKFSFNACPYLCIPYNSFHSSGSLEGDKCEAPDSTIVDQAISISFTEYYYTDDFTRADDFFGKSTVPVQTVYTDCTYYGAILEDDELGIDEFSTVNDAKYEVGDPRDTYESYPVCKTLIQTASSDPSIYNTAWTDRLLNSVADYNVAGVYIADNIYRQETLNEKYGASISPDSVAGANGVNIKDQTPIILPACITLNGESLHPAPADDLTNCPGSTVTAFGNANPPQARRFISWTVTGFTSANMSLASGETRADIANRLEAIFADFIRFFHWDSQATSANLEVGGDGLGEYNTRSKSNPHRYYKDVKDEYGKKQVGVPPTIIAINSRKCFGSYCEEGERNAMTLNSENSGDHFGSGGFFRAQLKFYAEAYKEQLPIRRVIVDWQDDSPNGGSPAPDNFYKNHRGLEEGSKTKTICDRCADGADPDKCEWGMTAQSCDANFFSYQHNYSCTDADIIQYSKCDYDSEGIILNSPCKDLVENVCIFQPRVHIRDNWGWCTGVCDSGGSKDTGKPGCFDAFGGLTINDNLSECNYTKFPDADPATDPWVYYTGQIRVEPR